MSYLILFQPSFWQCKYPHSTSVEWCKQTPTFICSYNIGIAFPCWFLSGHLYLNILHSPQLNSQNYLMNNTVIYTYLFWSKDRVMKHPSIILSQCYFFKKAFFFWNNSILFLTVFCYSGDFTHAKNIDLLSMWKLSSHSKEKKGSLQFF